MNTTKQSFGKLTIGIILIALIAGFGGGLAGSFAAPGVQAFVAATKQSMQPIVIPADRYAGIPQSIDAAGHPVLGVAGAAVTITEYSDFQCPFCTRFHGDAYPQIVDGQVRTGAVAFTYRHLPLPFHAQAQLAAESAACAADGGKFWQMHDAIFANEALWAENENAQKTFVKIATKLGLDEEKFQTCLDTGAKKTLVSADMQEAQTLGLTGTPSFTIGSERIEGAYPYASFAEAIAKVSGGVQPAETTATTTDVQPGA